MDPHPAPQPVGGEEKLVPHLDLDLGLDIVHSESMDQDQRPPHLHPNDLGEGLFHSTPTSYTLPAR